MLLDHLGEPAAGRRLMAAVEAVTGRGAVLTPDLGGTATTAAVTEAVIAALAGANA
jgi:tartrate dehydrogenase/decarboxylase/D-malate dehydrogenase